MESKAKKKRRWGVAVALASLALALWLVWPTEIDPRFIGTWRLSVTSSVYKLEADGTFIYIIDGEPVRRSQWGARKGKFYNLHSYKGWEAVCAWFDRIRKGKAKADQAYPVVKVTSDAIVLKEPPHGNFVLLRVPDGFVPPKTRPGLHHPDDRDEVDKAHQKRMRAVDPERYADE